MTARILFEIVGTGNGIKAVQRNINDLSRATDDVSKKTRAAANSAEDLYSKQNKGVIGTANSTKSFSKLAQTIGDGGSGLVGAYATLAANAFAVSAAFSALRTGAQVDQILKGLELQGARTGNALTLTAKGIQDITQGALSASEAMSAAALGTSAGLNRKDIEELTTVATNASLALGRSIPDSMERIIKGVTKLEPELLDELGLMTKLTEASENYARSNGKSAASLTNFEKRLAFVEAIKVEGKNKFDGIAEGIGVNQLDQLAASFQNLAHEMSGSVATSSAVSAGISVLTDSSYGLEGALLLLGAYVAKQYTGGLRASTIATLKASDALSKKAQVLRESTKARVGDTKATLEAAKADTKSALALGRRPKASTAALQESAIKGDEAAQNKIIKLREDSNKRYKKQIDDLMGKEDEASKKKLARMEAEKTANTWTIDSMKALQAAQTSYSKAADQTRLQEIRTRAAQQGSLALGRAALAMEAAGAFKVGQAYNNVIASTVSYKKSLTLAAEASRQAGINATANGRATSIMAGAINLVQPAAIGARVAVHGLTLGVKTLGVAFATVLPWIGVITVAFSMLQSVYENFLKSDLTKAKEKALENLNTVLETVIKSVEEFRKVQNATNLTLSGAAIKSATIQTNAMVELSNSFIEATDAYSEFNKQLAKPISSFDKDANILKDELGLVSEAAVSASRKMITGWDRILPFVDVFDEQEISILKTLEALSEYDQELANSIVVTKDNAKTVENMRTALRNSLPFWEKSQKAVSNFTEALKSAELAQMEFMNSLVTPTKFDGAVSGFTQLNSSITELATTLGSGKFQNKSLVNFLAGLGPSVGKLLKPEDLSALLEAQAAYESINVINKEITAAESRKAAEGTRLVEQADLAKRIAELTEKRVGLENKIKTIGEDHVKSIVTTLQTQEDSLRRDQIRSITIQSQITLEQSRLEILQRQGTIVAADLRRQIDSQNAVKDLQAEQLKIEANYLEIQLEKEKSAANLLDKQISQLKLGNLLLSQQDSALKTQLELERSILSYTPTSNSLTQKNGQVADPAAEALAKSVGQRIQNIDEQLVSLTDTAKVAERYQALLDSQKKEIALAQARVDAANASAQAVLNSKLSESDKEIAAQQLTIQNADALSKTYLGIQAINEENQRVVEKTNALISGRTEFLYEEIKALKEQSKERQRALAQAAAFSIAELERQREGASEESKKELTNRIDAARKEYAASVQLEVSKTRLEVLQRGINLTIEDGIKSQQDSLAILQKQADLSEQIASANMDLERARARIAAKRMGGEIDPITEFVLAKKAAEVEYQTALNNHELRILAIDAEYDLLEAQRIGQAASLKASALTLEATLQATGGINEAQKNTIASVKSAAARLESSSYETARNQAKEVERLGLERLRLAKEEASIFSTGQGSAIGAAMANIGTILSGIKVPEAPEAVKIVSPDLQATKTIADQQLKATMLMVQEIKSSGFADVAINLNELVRILRSKEDSKAAADAITKAVTDSSISGDKISIKTMTQSLAKYVEANYRGAKVSELAGFGMKDNPKSGHGEGSMHYAGKAFDVNMVGGKQIDANDPKSKAALDKMAQDLSSRGMEVLWNGLIYRAGKAVGNISAGDHQHRDHLHAEFDAAAEYAIRKTMKNITSGIEAGASKAVKPSKTIFRESSNLREADNNKTIEDIMADKRTPSQNRMLPERRLVANDNEVTDLGDIVDKNILSMGKLVQAQLPVKLGMKEYGLIAAATFGAISTDLEKMKSNLDTVGQARMDVAIAISNMMANLGTLVPQTVEIMTTTFEDFKKENEKMLVGVDEGTARTMYKAQQMSAAFAAAAQVIAGVSAILQAQSNAKIASIDKEIAAEQKRDGKSAASVEKLQALEKKKDSMARKAFNTNKKLMMAQAVMSTAAGIAGALGSNPGITGIILAGIIGAMGAAQIAIIAGTQYESASSKTAAAVPSTLSVGKRSDTVDLARGPNANAGGEVGFLRGSAGSGSNAGNYNTVGSAYGGELMRGYGNRGFVVGEKGPEIITPETPISVTPTNEMQSQQPLNATFNIQALDSSGVQDLLVAQKGNIIKMLREAANASGTSFMEEVNVNVYTRPNVAKL